MTEPFAVHEEVRAALAAGRPVVAVETSVLSHGLPRPENEEAARRMAAAVRERGGEPAWVWVGGGSVRLGATDEDLARLCDPTHVAKVARRDLPMAVAGGGLGGTTVSATVWATRRAGISVAATGGIGGVHRGTGDVSADLAELARTPVALVCSGPKSILDPVATAERLEELGVGLLGYRTGRLPFFVAREAPVPLEHRADDPAAVAAVLRARAALEVGSALLVCNPVPAEAALDPTEVGAAVERCLERAAGATGKEVTPFLLRCLAEETGGRTLRANLALLEANAALAADVAALL
ncbi:MAG: pseudouridine-5'-phosphate glycosidase [Actinomycetota bacterium]